MEKINKAEARGVLKESNDDAPTTQRRRARGGKASRARRLEKYQQTQTTASTTPATPTASLAELASNLLRQHRANLRDDVRAAWLRARLTRAKIRSAVWRAWTYRSVENVGGLDIWRDNRRQLVTGEALAPLSRRDLWILKRAVDFMMAIQLRDPNDDIADPTRWRYYRATLDWLRVPSDEGPHWIHTELLDLEETPDDSDYSSDEDDPRFIEKRPNRTTHDRPDAAFSY